MSDETINEVSEEGYKYLRIMELDRVKEQEMRNILRNEYMRRLKLVMNGGSKIKACKHMGCSLIAIWRSD